jgi:hypothetical protein
MKGVKSGCAPVIEFSGIRRGIIKIGIDPRHRQHYLSLLPSGPDEVRKRLLRGGRSECLPKFMIHPSNVNSAPHKADFGKRAPLTPRLAQPVANYSQALIFFQG